MEEDQLDDPDASAGANEDDGNNSEGPSKNSSEEAIAKIDAEIDRKFEGKDRLRSDDIEDYDYKIPSEENLEKVEEEDDDDDDESDEDDDDDDEDDDDEDSEMERKVDKDGKPNQFKSLIAKRT